MFNNSLFKKKKYTVWNYTAIKCNFTHTADG